VNIHQVIPLTKRTSEYTTGYTFNKKGQVNIHQVIPLTKRTCEYTTGYTFNKKDM